LSLHEVQQYGVDSLANAVYLSAWRRPSGTAAAFFLGRTVVECTCDALADRIGRGIADVAAKLNDTFRFGVIDPFAGSCNTLYCVWDSLRR
jgi:hypothetical protein